MRWRRLGAMQIGKGGFGSICRVSIVVGTGRFGLRRSFLCLSWTDRWRIFPRPRRRIVDDDADPSHLRNDDLIRLEFPRPLHLAFSPPLALATLRPPREDIPQLGSRDFFPSSVAVAVLGSGSGGGDGRLGRSDAEDGGCPRDQVGRTSTGACGTVRVAGEVARRGGRFHTVAEPSRLARRRRRGTVDLRPYAAAVGAIRRRSTRSSSRRRGRPRLGLLSPLRKTRSESRQARRRRSGFFGFPGRFGSRFGCNDDTTGG